MYPKMLVIETTAQPAKNRFSHRSVFGKLKKVVVVRIWLCKANENNKGGYIWKRSKSMT